MIATLTRSPTDVARTAAMLAAALLAVLAVALVIGSATLRDTWWPTAPRDTATGGLGEAASLTLHNLVALGWPLALRALGWRRWDVTRHVAAVAIAAMAAVHLVVAGTAIVAWPSILGLLTHGPFELVALACVIDGWRATDPRPHTAAFAVAILLGAIVEANVAPW